MKIKLSKSQWELIGQKTGWNKTAVVQDTNKQMISLNHMFNNKEIQKSTYDIFKSKVNRGEFLDFSNFLKAIAPYKNSQIPGL